MGPDRVWWWECWGWPSALKPQSQALLWTILQVPLSPRLPLVKFLGSNHRDSPCMSVQVLRWMFTPKHKSNFICWELKQNPNPNPSKNSRQTTFLNIYAFYFQAALASTWKMGLFHIIPDVSEDRKHSYREAVSGDSQSGCHNSRGVIRAMFLSK